MDAIRWLAFAGLALVVAGLPTAPCRAHDLFAVWSPDGAHIALTSDRTGDWEIHMARQDGSDLRRLTDQPGRDAHPAFTPDGGGLLFQSPRNPGAVRLFHMAVTGGEATQIAATSGFCGVPAVSPDGQTVAFMCSSRAEGPGQPGNPWGLFLMPTRGGAIVRLAVGDSNDQVPVWTPDGRALVFFSDRSGQDQLHRLDLASGTVIQLTHGSAAHRTAAFTPDGSLLLTLRSDGPGDHALVAMSPAGEDPRVILHTASDFGAPSVSPDGLRVLFPDMLDGQARIGVANMDGTDRRLIAFTD